MAAMQDFTIWILEQLPAFLMTEPICYIVAMIITAFCVKFIRSIIFF